MAKTLDFNKVTKHYLTVTLSDVKRTTLMIGTPDKKLMRELSEIQGSLDEKESIDDDKMDALYNLCARLMSRNKGGIVIDQETLEAIFDFEDIVIFFHAYTDFINEVMGTKN